jgi:hypothetical protein
MALTPRRIINRPAGDPLCNSTVTMRMRRSEKLRFECLLNYLALLFHFASLTLKLAQFLGGRVSLECTVFMALLVSHYC